MLENFSILVIGRTGYLVHSFLPMMLKKYNSNCFMILSRDEMNKCEMA